jgi:hypothetical protein
MSKFDATDLKYQVSEDYKPDKTSTWKFPEEKDGWVLGKYAQRCANLTGDDDDRWREAFEARGAIASNIVYNMNSIATSLSPTFVLGFIWNLISYPSQPIMVSLHLLCYLF